MGLTLFIHIIAGGLALVAGFVALYAAKGARLHRRSGVVFVYSMVAMALAGAGMAALNVELGNVIAGLLTTYLVVTALITVRPSTPATRRLEAGAMLWAAAVGLAGVAVGIRAIAFGDGTLEGVRAPIFLVFGAIALLSSAGDARMLRLGGLRGSHRLKRHLWRMCFALWIASASFFLGQADEIPEPLRIPMLLAIPVLTPLLAMVYWLWRVRSGRSAPDIMSAVAPAAMATSDGHRAAAVRMSRQRG